MAPVRDAGAEMSPTGLRAGQGMEFLTKGGESEMLIKREEGQGLVEYALIIFLIAILLIVALQFLGPQIGSVFSSIGNTLSGVVT
jgi:pilus assembly protein Flp/PilA